MSDRTVSLYVPCYNGARWIAECLDALLAQTRPAAEVLVVDDGSTDDSAAIVAAYAPRVRLISHPRNLGLAVARNTALGAARGEIVASVDADVRATPAWLARLLTAFSSPRVAAAGGRLVEAHQERLADRWRAAHMAQHAGDFPLRDPPVLPGANVAVRRALITACGGYSEAFRTNYEDADLQHRLRGAGYLCAYEPGALAYHLRTDGAASVLRTYWGWLRPPFEARGAFRDAAGLLDKAVAGAGFARRALWRDFGAGDADLTYLSLLVLLAFPAADLAYAARRAGEAGDGPLATALGAQATAWMAQAPQALRHRSAPLAARAGGDLARLAWWDAAPGAAVTGARAGAKMADAPATPAPDVTSLLTALRAEVEALPRAWWPAIEGARQRLAGEEGWPLGPPVPAGGPIGVSPELFSGGLAGVGEWLARAAGPDVQGVVLHGAGGRGEAIPWAPIELLLVSRRPLAPLSSLAPPALDRLRRQLVTRIGRSDVLLEAIEGYRLGWMAPSLLQQSLLAGAVLLHGEEAVLRAIPGWPPERLDPRLALDESAKAADDLRRGAARLAVARAAGALLLARRAYTPWIAPRAALLRQVWPEAPEPRQVTAERFVERAAELARDWLFTWEGRGPGSAAIARFRGLRAGVPGGVA